MEEERAVKVCGCQGDHLRAYHEGFRDGQESIYLEMRETIERMKQEGACPGRGR